MGNKMRATRFVGLIQKFPYIMAVSMATLISPSIVKWHLRDLAYRFLPKPLSGFFYAASVVIAFGRHDTLACDLLMQAHRYNPSDFLSKRVKCKLDTILARMPKLMGPPVDLTEAASRSIVLKLPQIDGTEIERGVLLITFTDTFRYYYYNIDLARLAKYFYVVLEPSWAGYCLPEILFWCNTVVPVIVESTEPTDRKFLDIIDKNLKHVSFGASDWVDYRIFRPLNLTKTYDAIYVANYGPIKRLHVYFRAIKEAQRTKVDFRAALLCASWGQQRSTVMHLIKSYGVGEILELYEDANYETVNELLNRSKVNLLLSLKEGSNRSLFEAMFADTPVIALKNNVGINKSYINTSTGVLINEHELAQTLLHFRRNHNNYHPREWAIAHISPEVTTNKLLKVLHTLEPPKRPQLHNNDNVFVKVNSPEVSYFLPSLALANKKRRFKFNSALLDHFSVGAKDEDEIIAFLQKCSIH